MEPSAVVLAEFACPSCQRFMHPPIKVCIFGHSICDPCHKRVKRCPVCGAQKNRLSRNYIMEKLHGKLILPCSYRLEGCTSTGLGTQAKTHEEFCQHSVKACPLLAINNCKWVGQQQEAVAHCLENHPTNAYSSNHQQLMCSKFLHRVNSVDQSYHILFYAYGEVFRCIWNSDFDTGFMLWTVTYVGPREEAKKYYYEIEFQNQNNVEEVIKLQATCQPLQAAEEAKDNRYLLTHTSMFKTFCKDKNLYYTVSIQKVQEGAKKDEPQEAAGAPRSDPHPCKFWN